MFPKDQLKASSTVTIKPFSNWKIATGLPKVSGQANTFRAENYDILYDSPFEVSDFRQFDFTVEGKTHRIVFSGEGNYDMGDLYYIRHIFGHKPVLIGPQTGTKTKMF